MVEINTNRLRALRIERSIVQDEMAKKLGIVKQTYSRKETNQAEFTLSEAKKIADIFNLPIEEVFFKDRLRRKQ